eukprot:scaffold79311_cov59-Phaeocystis_antarctica.AAC.4
MGGRAGGKGDHPVGSSGMLRETTCESLGFDSCVAYEWPPQPIVNRHRRLGRVVVREPQPLAALAAL